MNDHFFSFGWLENILNALYRYYSEQCLIHLGRCSNFEMEEPIGFRVTRGHPKGQPSAAWRTHLQVNIITAVTMKYSWKSYEHSASTTVERSFRGTNVVAYSTCPEVAQEKAERSAGRNVENMTITESPIDTDVNIDTLNWPKCLSRTSEASGN